MDWLTKANQYWSQILVIIGVVGFFWTSYWNLRIKKTEIKFNLFAQKRIDAVTLFVSSFYDLTREVQTKNYSLVCKKEMELYDVDMYSPPNYPNFTALEEKCIMSIDGLLLFFDNKETDLLYNASNKISNAVSIIQEMVHIMYEPTYKQEEISALAQESLKFVKEADQIVKSFLADLRKNY